MRTSLLALCAGLALAPVAAWAQLDQDAGGVPDVQGQSQAQGKPFEKKWLPVRVTFYYTPVITELEKSAPGAREFQTAAGPIYLSAGDIDKLHMEGSAWIERLSGGRKYITYEGKIMTGRPAKYMPFRSVAGDLGNRNKDPDCKPGKRQRPPCQPYKDGKLRFGPKGIRTAYIRELRLLKEKGLLDEANADGSVAINDTGGNIYGLHFDLFCDSHEKCRAVQSKLKKLEPKPESADGGFLLHMTFKCAELVPDDYSHGLRAADSDEERNALRPPVWEGIPEDPSGCL